MGYEPPWAAVEAAVAERWARELAGPGAKPPADLAHYVAAYYPDAAGAARARGAAFGVRSALSATRIGEHALFHLYFGWAQGSFDFETYSGVFGLGPLGFARLSQRPAAAAALLAHERIRLPEPTTSPSASYEIERTARDLAPLLDEVFGADHNPDTMDRPDRDAHMRSGLFDETQSARIDRGDPQVSFLPVDREAWRALRPALVPVRGRPAPEAFVVDYSTADAIGGGMVELRRHSVAIERATYALSHAWEPIGTLACTTPAHPVIGRPFEIGGTRIRAGLVRRNDWGGSPPKR
jgi:hypothetical protein